MTKPNFVLYNNLVNLPFRYPFKMLRPFHSVFGSYNIYYSRIPSGFVLFVLSALNPLLLHTYRIYFDKKYISGSPIG